MSDEQRMHHFAETEVQSDKIEDDLIAKQKADREALGVDNNHGFGSVGPDGVPANLVTKVPAGINELTAAAGGPVRSEREQTRKERRAGMFRAPVDPSANPEPAAKRLKDAEEAEEDNSEPASIIVQFEALDGSETGPQIEVPLSTTPKQLEAIVNELLGQSDEPNPYAFYIKDLECMLSLAQSVKEQKLSTETTLVVKFEPQANFRVRPVTRCTDTMQGHSEAILHVKFSPDGSRLASGGGDATVRFWDVNTSLPVHTCVGHKHWVLCTAWSPDGRRFVSGDMKGEIRIWDPATGKQLGQALKGHKKHITTLTFQPMHRSKDASCEIFASSSKDKTIKVWNARTGRCLASLSGHTDSVEQCIWGGQGLLYSASRDRTIKVWAVEEEGRDMGKLVRTLTGHAHRINTLALNLDYVCRTGPFDHTGYVLRARLSAALVAKLLCSAVCESRMRVRA